MTLNQILDWTDLTHPSAYTPAQKTAWVSDLESRLWTQIFLQSPGLWRPYRPDTDGWTRLLLPEGWRRIYTAYLDAMIDLANGEYGKYQNDMALYNGYICELGAWYADAFAPAGTPARWTEMGAAAYDVLADGPCRVGLLGAQDALLAVECRVTEAFQGGGALTVGAEDGTALARLDLDGDGAGTGVGRYLSFLPPRGRPEGLVLTYAGDGLTAGQLAVRALAQPPAARPSRFSRS